MKHSNRFPTHRTKAAHHSVRSLDTEASKKSNASELDENCTSICNVNINKPFSAENGCVFFKLRIIMHVYIRAKELSNVAFVSRSDGCGHSTHVLHHRSLAAYRTAADPSTSPPPSPLPLTSHDHGASRVEGGGWGERRGRTAATDYSGVFCLPSIWWKRLGGPSRPAAHTPPGAQPEVQRRPEPSGRQLCKSAASARVVTVTSGRPTQARSMKAVTPESTPACKSAASARAVTSGRPSMERATPGPP